MNWRNTRDRAWVKQETVQTRDGIDVIRFFLTAAFIVVMATAAFSAAANDPPDFVGRIAAGTIATISDGDFVGQSYATGRLAPAEAGYRDTLTKALLSVPTANWLRP
jgi:phosphate/sulfate permease